MERSKSFSQALHDIKMIQNKDLIKAKTFKFSYEKSKTVDLDKNTNKLFDEYDPAREKSEFAGRCSCWLT